MYQKYWCKGSSFIKEEADETITCDLRGGTGWDPGPLSGKQNRTASNPIKDYWLLLLPDLPEIRRKIVTNKKG